MEELENEFHDDEITKILLGKNDYAIHKANKDYKDEPGKIIMRNRQIREEEARQAAAAALAQQQAAAAALAQQQAAQPGGN